MNIHTSKWIFLAFVSPEKKKKSVKDVPFTASTFTNVQLYRKNKSITRNLEQGLSNTTTTYFQLILHLTAHILHVIYKSYEAKKPSLWALQVNCIAFNGPAHLTWPPIYCTCIPNQLIRIILIKKNLYILTKKQNHYNWFFKLPFLQIINYL